VRRHAGHERPGRLRRRPRRRRLGLLHGRRAARDRPGSQQPVRLPGATRSPAPLGACRAHRRLMAPFLIRRLFWAVFLLLAATIATYVICSLARGAPARLAGGRACTPADVERVRRRLHRDEPIYQQYAHFLWNLVGHQSLGTSYANRVSVNYYISQEVPVTAS